MFKNSRLIKVATKKISLFQVKPQFQVTKRIQTDPDLSLYSSPAFN